MNSQQVIALIQSLLMILGGIGVAHGYLDQTQITTIGGAIPAVLGGIGVIIGAIWNHSDAAKGK